MISTVKGNRCSGRLAVLLVSLVAFTGCDKSDSFSNPSTVLRWIDADPDWSPDGRRIAFSRGGTESIEEPFNLHWVDVRSGRVHALTRGEGHIDRDPAWSPDGRTIAFVRSTDSLFCNEDDTIRLVLAGGSRFLAPRYKGCDPAWSPDGSRLAFSTANSSFAIAPSAGGAVRNVATDVFAYDWSPDGSRLVLERSNEIWVVDADGKALRRVAPTTSGGVAQGPRWSPDGTLILHNRFEHGRQGLWVMRPAGRGAHQIAAGEIQERGWSPDGRRVFFARTGSDGGVFVADRDGGHVRRLLPPFEGESLSDWSPRTPRLAVGGTTRGTLSPDPYRILVLEIDTGRSLPATQRERR